MLYNILNDKVFSEYMGLFVICINSLYISYFWFIICLVARGWQIYFLRFNEYYGKKYLYVFMFYFIFFSFDDLIMYITDNEVVFNYYSNDIKNVIMFITLSIFSFINTYESIELIYHRINSIRFNDTELLNILNIKLFIFRTTFIFSILYVIIYVIIVLFQSILNNSDKALYKFMTINILDILTITGLMYILF
jgi:hypothetical protein